MTSKIQILLIVSVTFTIGLVSCNSTEQKIYKPTNENVFSKIDFDEAIAYNYDGEGGIDIIDKENGKLANKIKKQFVLDKTQAIKFTNQICDSTSYGGDIAACFDPHLGLVFYKTQKPVAYISICLDCNYLVSSIDIPNSQGGFSDKGINHILNFEKEIGF